MTGNDERAGLERQTMPRCEALGRRNVARTRIDAWFNVKLEDISERYAVR